MPVKPIPDGYHTVTPYMHTADAAGAIDFYKKAFGATELYRLGGPGGKVMHSELVIGDSRIMLADEFPEMGARGPKAIGGTPVTIHLYVEDVDSVVEQAIAAGATVRMPVRDMFYGDRSGAVEDPFGHVWNIATHQEDVPHEQLHARFEEAMKKQKGPS